MSLNGPAPGIPCNGLAPAPGQSQTRAFRLRPCLEPERELEGLGLLIVVVEQLDELGDALGVATRRIPACPVEVDYVISYNPPSSAALHPRATAHWSGSSGTPLAMDDFVILMT